MNPFVLIVLLLAIGATASHFAKQRGRNPRAWFILGFLFGLLGLLALFLLPPLKAIARAQVPPTPSPTPSFPQVKKILIKALDAAHSDKLWYYLDEDHQQLGPMSLNALSQAWEEGKVKTTTYVWNEHLANWQFFNQVLGPVVD